MSAEGRIDMTAIVGMLHRADIAAYVEQTGGGCATIYVGERNRVIADDPDYLYWELSIGPGTFDWDGDEHVGFLGDFYMGPHDQGESDIGLSFHTETDTEIAALAVVYINTLRLTGSDEAAEDAALALQP